MLRGRWHEIYLLVKPNKQLLEQEYEHLKRNLKCRSEEEFSEKLQRIFMLQQNYPTDLHLRLSLSIDLKAKYDPAEPDGTGEINTQNLFAYTHGLQDEVLRDAMNRSERYSLYTFLVIMSV